MLDRVELELKRLGVAPLDAPARNLGAAPGARDALPGRRVPANLANRSTGVILRRIERELTRARQDLAIERSRQQLAEMTANRRCTCPPT
jgi:signal-transduction protein with cAMP-binding, CBS, and nucleotidyltransferase domain